MFILLCKWQSRMSHSCCSFRLSIVLKTEAWSFVCVTGIYRETLDTCSPYSIWLYHIVHSSSWYSFSAQLPSLQTLAIQTQRRLGGFVIISTQGSRFRLAFVFQCSIPLHSQVHQSKSSSFFGSPFYKANRLVQSKAHWQRVSGNVVYCDERWGN